ncbi:MAG TPA: hypothetical protein H9679_01515 [Firmicutes bacterium]|nr:hypothetical protein [Bacillota bacterium]
MIHYYWGSRRKGRSRRPAVRFSPAARLAAMTTRRSQRRRMEETYVSN